MIKFHQWHEVVGKFLPWKHSVRIRDALRTVWHQPAKCLPNAPPQPSPSTDLTQTQQGSGNPSYGQWILAFFHQDNNVWQGTAEFGRTAWPGSSEWQELSSEVPVPWTWAILPPSPTGWLSTSSSSASLLGLPPFLISSCLLKKIFFPRIQPQRGEAAW